MKKIFWGLGLLSGAVLIAILLLHKPDATYQRASEQMELAKQDQKRILALAQSPLVY